jgi:hypothetical protein
VLVLVSKADRGPVGLGQTAVSVSRGVVLGARIDAEFLSDMGELFRGSTRRRSVIIARNAVRPASVKNSRGKCPSVSSRMRPRAINPFAVGGSFGLPASGPLPGLEVKALGHAR